jgi:hypothetical protein
MTFFTETEKNPKIYMEAKKTPNSQSNPGKRNNAVDTTILDFELHCKATLTKTVCY